MPYEYNIYATLKKREGTLSKMNGRLGGHRHVAEDSTQSVPNHTLGIKCVVFWDGVSSYFSCVASFFCVCVSDLVGPAS